MKQILLKLRLAHPINLNKWGVFEQHQTEITAQDKAVHLVTVPLEKASNIVQAELLEGFGVELENID